VIIGGGPAGLAAALYAARDGYKTLVLEKNGLPGGQIMLTERIENYPGFEHISGPDLIQHQVNQAKNFGAVIKANQMVDKLVRRADGLIAVGVNEGEHEHHARAVILAPGSDYRRLGVPGEEEMRQATRVSYCATCDGAFYRDKHVLCVGGGNTAVEDTIYLARRFTRAITLVHRRREFRAQKVLVDELHGLSREKNINILTPFVIEEIVPTHDRREIDHVRVRDVETNRVQRVQVDGVFVFVGMVPNTGFLRGSVNVNEQGFIICDCSTLKTSMPGVFVAGDCRWRAAMQLSTAVGDGVVAALMLKDYFRDPNTWGKTMAEDGATSGW
jgi:thioredoxin reductase (NADPH)